MKIFKTNKNLAIISFIAIVNALGYGIVIPILYSYSRRFGLSDFQNGLLFALFSLCQFVATPLIGRLSDKYGRRPLLIASISGTVVSFILMAFAPSALFLFIARALDGVTAGNIPVATAVIADTTTLEERAKGFGILGAAFGFGFVFGPAISALTVGISPSVPFIIAAIISLFAVIITALFLPETNRHLGEVKHGKLFDFPKLLHSLFDPNLGLTFIISLFYFFSVFLFIYAFQPYMVKVLALSVNQIATFFTLFGIVGLLMQMFIVQKVAKRFGAKHALSTALFVASLSFLGMYAAKTVITFISVLIVFSMANALVQPLITTILSQETDAKSQGSMMGLNASYMSIGQILGPIVGGTLATYSISLPFVAAAIMAFACFMFSFYVLKPNMRRESAF